MIKYAAVRICSILVPHTGFFLAVRTLIKCSKMLTVKFGELSALCPKAEARKPRQ